MLLRVSELPTFREAYKVEQKVLNDLWTAVHAAGKVTDQLLESVVVPPAHSCFGPARDRAVRHWLYLEVRKWGYPDMTSEKFGCP